MNFIEYKKWANNTRPKNQTEFDDLQHAIIGVNTEMFELLLGIRSQDKINIAEEAGDNFWYCALGLNGDMVSFADHAFYKFSENEIPNFYSEASLNYFYEAYACANYLLDSLKKNIYYKKPFDMDVVNHQFIKIGVMFSRMYPYQQCLDANIAKLAKRYPDGFAEYHALNRNLDAELKTLKENL